MSNIFKSFKNLIIKLDYFSITFQFHYKLNNNYKSFFGGTVFLLFLFFSIIFTLLNINNFIERKNMSLINYTKQLESAEEISFSNHSNIFAFGLKCEFNQNIYDYLNVNVVNIIINSTNGNKTKKYNVLPYHPCTEQDFYNAHNESFHLFELKNYYCPIKTKLTMKGLYNDNIFSYYEISATIKSNETKFFQQLENILLNDQCRFEIYHMDTHIDAYKFDNPVYHFLNNHYVMLNPSLLLKMNIFFKKTIFTSYENYFYDKSYTNYYLEYSNSEKYFLEKGFQRYINKPKDYEVFSKIYLRSSMVSELIQRKYMKLSEFIAQIISFLSTTFIVLYLIIGKINYILSYQKILLDIFTIKNFSNKFEIQRIEINNINSPLRENYDKNSITSRIDLINNNKINIKENNDIKINNNNNNIKKIYSNKIPIKKRNSDLIYAEKNIKFVNDLEKGYNLIKTNIFEFIIIFFFKCYSSKKRKYIFDTSKKIFLELDILNYLKKINQIELIKNCLFNNKLKDSVNFISKPFFTIYKKEYLKNYYNYRSNYFSKDEINIFIKNSKDLLNNQFDNKIELNLMNMIKNLIPKRTLILYNNKVSNYSTESVPKVFKNIEKRNTNSFALSKFNKNN